MFVNHDPLIQGGLGKICSGCLFSFSDSEFCFSEKSLFLDLGGGSKLVRDRPLNCEKYPNTFPWQYFKVLQCQKGRVETEGVDRGRRKTG